MVRLDVVVVVVRSWLAVVVVGPDVVVVVVRSCPAVVAVPGR
ncbi:hypothetical protein [Streptomyces cahuitamycinicus]|nr:hypothetical protein [Streptomyces cahuitamycinicus]